MCLFYMEFFSMVARGFSMRLITDIQNHKKLSSEDIMNEYSNGKGIEWLLDKRIKGILDLGFIEEKDDTFKLSSKKSELIVNFSIFFKRLLKLGKGG